VLPSLTRMIQAIHEYQRMLPNCPGLVIASRPDIGLDRSLFRQLAIPTAAPFPAEPTG
jgi:hypothetical protein